MTEYDPEYVIELWDYTRKYEPVEQCVQIMAGNSIEAYGDGIEALESYHFPEVGTAPRVSAQQLEEMPPKLAEKVWERELDILDVALSAINPDKQDIFKLINWLETGNAVLGVEVESHIVDAIHELPECESKVDMLEKHGEIGGEEWFDRASELAG